MDKLSERLWVMRVSLENLTDDELATFDEAIEQAKRYEDAPKASVTFWGGGLALDEPESGRVIAEAKRVRIVLDKEG